MKALRKKVSVANRSKTLRGSKGIALLITLAILGAVVTLSLEMNRRERSSVTQATIQSHRLALSEMASTGVQIAMAMLIKDKSVSETDSVQGHWANPDSILSVVKELPFETGELTVVIGDERGKIQVNALVQGDGGRQFNESQKELWARFLKYMNMHLPLAGSVDTDTIIESLKDWMDDDDRVTGLHGAKSDYYLSLTPPYRSRNGHIPNIGEMLLVKGVTADLFWGDSTTKGLSAYVTSYHDKDTSAGMININTADVPVLAAMLPSGREDIAQMIADYRTEKSNSDYVNDLSDPSWYQKVPGIQDDVMDSQLICTSSDVFRIRATARMDHLSVTTTALIHRETTKTGKNHCRILEWLTE